MLHMTDNSHSNFVPCRIVESGTTPVDFISEGAIFSDVAIKPLAPFAEINKLPEEDIVVTEHVDFSNKH